jgi:hypothetical protein
MTRLIAVLLALVLGPSLAGCSASLQGLLTNRVVINVAQDGCATNSRWFGLSIGADVDERDCRVIVDALRLRTAMEALAAAQAAGAR